jgi:hypothetical protein
MQALAAFGAPVVEITQADFARPGVVYQIGVPPGRIDILTELTGLTFERPGAIGFGGPSASSRSISSIEPPSCATSARRAG